MERTSATTSRAYTKRFTALTLTVMAILSPLYIDRTPPPDPDLYYYEGRSNAAWLLPLFLLLLLAGSAGFSSLLDSRRTRLDPNWIHRAGGSTAGIVATLAVLGVVLKCRYALRG